MVTCTNASREAQAEFEKENSENIAQLYNHPSIVVWVLFNEGWARYDQERLTQTIRQYDPSRLVNGHSGENYDRGAPQNPNDKWAGSDLTDVHEYPGPGLAPALPGKARVLGEWGGVRVSSPGHQWNATEGWGYIQVPAAGFADKYAFMLRHLELYEEEGLSGSIYTQPFDVETEENGLMTYDREVIKIPAEKLRQLHSALQPSARSYADILEIKPADITNPDNQYPALLAQYNQGTKESEFLRNLALMAVRVNDKKNAEKISGEYIKAMPDPYTRANISFISQFTKSVIDPGFQIFLKHPERIDAVLGANQAEQKVMNIIFQDEILPFINSQGKTPNWAMFEKHITTLYGNPGEEIYLRARVIHSLNNNDWDNFSAAIIPYIVKYGERISPGDLNIFGAFVSVNAERMYKLGQKIAAIEWLEKALAMVSEKDKPAIKASLEKMKGNQKAP
ncbi:Glycosyl hydrolases family 2, TIM barrel domain [Chitinophaga sp. CF118]|uniref:glycoside hydrolase family 2 TIM barrel-domain containing protein n=1 Tax=Chitinophaga sp. CF118 TaxID=1884367 RepID=UPI0008E04332|nr:glycoside hydrolase family 2 TIM barrel-domain containing protein [Chitinophaga sp. CF118]SFD20332.1 Glycosyl hydrolases family 2, TIM barrel domain [Chitinophaga sp. CF118]